MHDAELSAMPKKPAKRQIGIVKVKAVEKVGIERRGKKVTATTEEKHAIKTDDRTHSSSRIIRRAVLIATLSASGVKVNDTASTEPSAAIPPSTGPRHSRRAGDAD
jgi:hypothetical protein